MSSDYQYDLLRTYRYVRAGMIFLVALLGTSLFIEARAHHFSIQPSISAYYYTPVKPVFVAALCAIGVLMIVYRGNTSAEDGFLNASGFLAFVVAFVPTRPEDSCVVSDLPGDTVSAISNNTSALFIVATAAFVFTMLLERLSPDRNLLGSRGGQASVVFSLLAFALLALYFVTRRDSFICNGHNTAAVLLFVGIVIVVGLNGWGLAVKQAAQTNTTPREHRWNRYFYGFVLMLVSIALVVVLGPVTHVLANWVFWLEGALIGQFATFWITQTAELWNEPQRGAPIVPPKS
ncbi:hypothetical protein [Nostocoides sp. HKS02]|uniref:hypothetical protein n=1 Tax=Nostocoides sp. HKS02 TaxID=1813880 RepID=UPI0012B4DC46|nr:hypothetical protein [Tetrasphaera sp. HKS02]QGN58777.1 hypothetical protein GKE56_13825 [Tetrasphaera sp. HKS02]